jgi:hypothetical protein
MVDSPLASAAFWTATGERAISTFAQTLIAAILVGDRVLGILDVNWPGALSTAALAMLLAVLKGVAAARYGNSGPSLANERLAIPPQRGRHARRDPEDGGNEQLPAAVALAQPVPHRPPVDTVRRGPRIDPDRRVRLDRPVGEQLRPRPAPRTPRPEIPPDIPAGGSSRGEP